MAKFRFEDLEIWKEAIAIANELFDIADDLEERKKFRFSEQLRGAAMSISNNIAEGSASIFKKEFINYLNFARRSAFENVNILILLEKRKFIPADLCENLKIKLDILCRKITNFQKTLK